VVRAALLALALCGCGKLPPYHCDTNTDCSGGVCTGDKLCAVSDVDCASGLRFDTSAGDAANECVALSATGDFPERPLSLVDFQMVDLSAATDDYQPSCTPAPGGRDVFFQTTVEEVGRMYIDTFGSDFRAVVAVHRGACNARTAEVTCGTGSCDPRLQQWTGILEPGVHCIVVDRLDDTEAGTQLVLRSFLGDPARLGHLGENMGNTCDDDVWDGACAQTIDAPDTEWFVTSCVPTTITLSTCSTDPDFDGELQAYTLSEVEKACSLGCSAQIRLDEPGGVWLVAQARNDPTCDVVYVDISAQ
jgi:hypothetical protein